MFRKYYAILSTICAPSSSSFLLLSLNPSIDIHQDQSSFERVNHEYDHTPADNSVYSDPLKLFLKVVNADLV